MKDPCLKCNGLEKRNLFLEKSRPLSLHLEEADCPFFLQHTSEEQPKRCPECSNLFDNSPDAILIANAETGIILKANSKAAELFRIPVDQIVGQHQSSLHPPEESLKYKELFRDCAQGTAFLHDIVIQRKDGTQISIQVSGSVGEYRGEKIIYGFFRDMTLEKQQAEKIEESRQHFKQMADASSEGIIIHNLERNYLSINQRILNIYGYTEDEFKQIPLLELVAPQCRDAVAEKIESGFQGAYETLSVKKDGTIFPVSVKVKEVAIDSKSGRIVVINDLTEKKEMEQKLINRQKKYRQLYEMAHAPLFRTRINDGVLLDCSRDTAALFGYFDETEYKKNFSVIDAYVDPKRRQVFIETLKKNKRVDNFQIEFRRKDGTPIWVAVSAEISPDQNCIEGAMQDITVSKILTATERKILNHLMQGMSNKEIAYKTNRSIRTVEDHRSNIMRKLEVDNIVDLTRKAIESNIIPSDK